MEAAPYISFFIDFFKEGFTYSEEKKEKFLDAIFLVQEAINKTQNYISKNHDSYSPSTELADLWTRAARAIFPFDPSLSERLVIKADFWSYPERWIELGVGDTIVTLKELREITSMLRIKLK